uniref:Uncharacterized protein n=1 Tax=Anguilla anguilla TaxID=7936 RepID=A0A0E9XJS7_ANGAN
MLDQCDNPKQMKTKLHNNISVNGYIMYWQGSLFSSFFFLNNKFIGV